jgi:hypothetical protein
VDPEREFQLGGSDQLVLGPVAEPVRFRSHVHESNLESGGACL